MASIRFFKLFDMLARMGLALIDDALMQLARAYFATLEG